MGRRLGNSTESGGCSAFLGFLGQILERVSSDAVEARQTSVLGRVNLLVDLQLPDQHIKGL